MRICRRLKGAGRFLVSYEAGLDAALCIVAALYEREESQLGRFIDISKQTVMASRVDYVLGQMVAGDMDVTSKRTAFDLGGPAGIFRCVDGYAYIWMSAPAHWEGLRKLLGDPEWMKEFPERWLEFECTPERVAKCRHHLAEWLKTQEKEKASAAAQKLGVTLVAVNNAERPAGFASVRVPRVLHRGGPSGAWPCELSHRAVQAQRHAGAASHRRHRCSGSTRTPGSMH